MRSLLTFLEENYTDKCLEPLKLRINSSSVSADLETNGAATDPVVVKEATQLSAKIEETAQPAEASSAAADEVEAAFRERVRYLASIDKAYQKARRVLETLSKSGLPLSATSEAELPIADPSGVMLSQQP
jgi:phosphoglycolate phosphatase-like HAD superfamily hydrolase